jgi:hypothetical protein
MIQTENSNILSLIKKYDFKIDNNIKNNNNNEIIQIGIGDLLFVSLLSKNNVIQKPFYINMNIFFKNIYELTNIINVLEFKLRLLDKIFDKNDIIFYHDQNIIYSNWQTKIQLIQNFNLLQKSFDFKKIYDKDYIIFHTKCRFTGSFNYNDLKNKIKEFCRNFKTNHLVIILGERIMPTNFEVKVHKITTIYNELIELKNNNDVLDLTIDNIYDNLNFENYCNDMSLIHHAKTNIIVGHGGQYCNSLIFGQNITVYTLKNIYGNFDLDILKKENKNIFFDFNLFFKHITNNYLNL